MKKEKELLEAIEEKKTSQTLEGTDRVQRIKDHLFFKEHIKEPGVGRFEADYQIAQAWDRLQKGTFKTTRY